MSVLIKGMEIPKRCGSCPLRGVCKQRMYIEYRPKGCPLVEVPTPHGRLIDADKLMHDIEEYHLSDGKFQHWVDVQQDIIEAEGSE